MSGLPGVADGLETVHVTVPAAAAPAYEAALASVCDATGLFIEDEAAGLWRVEGVRARGAEAGRLEAALALAALTSGVSAALARRATDAEGWLARVYDGFPEQIIGRRFAVRGTHLAEARQAGRVTLLVDAGLAFGSGEHGSTRGCLRALEAVAHHRPRRILDLGCGSGILAIAAAKLLRGQVLASDIDPWAVRTARRNAALNQVRVRCRAGNGWAAPAVRAGRPYDLVLANILARPLRRMARDLAAGLAPGGRAILAGLLAGQARSVLAAHRRQGLLLERMLREGNWTTMVLRK